MNDPVEDVLARLRSNSSIRETRFTPNFLHSVGEIFERHGFATTRLYLEEKRNQSQTRRQAAVLLADVLPVLQSCKQIVENRAIGRYIIKALPTLQSGGNK